MTMTVFLSGSRKIGRINDKIRERVANMVKRDFRIVIGDANGADKALQGYLAAEHYQNVVVFCAGSVCRNNLGSWSVKRVETDRELTGREFYTQKDRAMAREADLGFVLWDGKSTGTINNILELIRDQKPIVVYFTPKKEFYTIRQPDDVRALLRHCSNEDYRSISKKIQIDRQLEGLGVSPQGVLSL